MIITDLLGARVFGPDFVGFITDARFRLRRFRHRCAVLPSSVSSPMPGSAFVGFVTDARFRLDTSSTGRPARLYGIVVSPHARSSSLGYERSDVRSPWPIAALVRWRHRGSFLVRWEDIERLDVRRINLRPGFTRVSSQLS